MVSLKYLRNSLTKLEMQLINCEVDIMLNWYRHCVIFSNALVAQVTKFKATDRKLYIPVATLSTQYNTKLFSNQNQALRERLTGIKINQYQYYNLKTYTF